MLADRALEKRWPDDTVPEVLVKPGVKVVQKFTSVTTIKQFDMSKLVRGADAYDSTEEYEFEAWCNDAQKLGLIGEYAYHPQAFTLCHKATYEKQVVMKTKTKRVEAFLMHPHEYTPDFKIRPTEKGWKFLLDRDLIVRLPAYSKATEDWLKDIYIDVKGGFSLYHDDKPFSINQKWVFKTYYIYIHKVVPLKWFKATWVPRAARYSPKKGKLRDKYLKCETFETIKEKL